MENKKIHLGKFLALAVLAGLLGLAGCAAQYMDPGPQAATVVVDMQAKVPSGAWPWPGQRYNQARWDWGLYLVEPGGELRKLRPRSHESMTSVTADQLVRRTSFGVPSGKMTLRLLASAWYYDWDRRGPNLVTLADYSKDYSLDLSSGGEQTIQARFGN